MINYFVFIFFILISVYSFAQQAIDFKDIPINKVLDNAEKQTVKEELKGKIFGELTPVKNDYVDNKNRGTVEFNPNKATITKFNGTPFQYTEEVLEAQNYSFQKVTIPNGTTLKEVNFSQKTPHTQAITGKNLTFINCNLNNVEIDPSWILIDSLSIQSESQIIEEGGKTYDVQYIEKNGQMVENQRTDLTPLPKP